MSRGSHGEDGAADAPVAAKQSVAQLLEPRTEGPAPGAAGGAFLHANGGVSPSHSLDIPSLRQPEPDEVVAGSDHDADKDSHSASNGRLFSSKGAADVGVVGLGRGVDPAAGELLLSFTQASPRSTGAMQSGAMAVSAPTELHLHTNLKQGQDGSKEETDRDATMGHPSASPDKAHGNAEAEREAAESAVESPKPKRRVRMTFKAKVAKSSKAANAKPKRTARQSEPPPPDSRRDVTVPELAVHLDKVTTQPPPEPPVHLPRTREKRRAPPVPSPVPQAPPKKSKTISRPKRAAAAAVTNYVDVTASDEDFDDDAVMVIAKFEQVVQAAPSAALAAAVPHPNTKKRKSMSQRQLDELLTEEREAGSSSPLPVGFVVNVARASTPAGVEVHKCEFCRRSHSAHAVFKCHSCLRVYHDKCFVNAFKSEVRDDDPIEAQMDRLHLYHPPGKSAVLRCTSCQAALIDFYNHQGLHWNCQCPTCMTAPEKIADYRRVSLKRIIDEHNLEFALKKEKKGTAPKKTAGGSAKAAVALPQTRNVHVAAETSANLSTKTIQSRSRGSRRNRGEDAPVIEPANLSEVAAPTSETKVSTPTKREPKQRITRGRGRGHVSVDSTNADTHACVAQNLDVDQEEAEEGGDMGATAHTELASGSGSSVAIVTASEEQGVTEVPIEEMDTSEKITVDILENLIAITKEDDQTWSFRVACSPSKKSHESGSYKEATLFWHPTRAKSLKCSCCDKTHQSLKWFVDHTDPKLLHPKKTGNEFNDVYSYMFVIQKSGTMVPLEDVLQVIRKRYQAVTKGRRLSDSSTSSYRRSSGSEGVEGGGDARLDGLQVLRNVRYMAKSQPPDQGSSKRRRSPPAQFCCEVICAEIRWLRPIGGTKSLLRNSIVDLSDDVYKAGTFDISESGKTPKTCKILCRCCCAEFNGTKFIQHTREPLLLEQERETKREAEKQREEREHYEKDEDSTWNESMDDETAEATENEVAASKKIRTFQCTAAVRMNDKLTLVRLDAFLSAIEKLGSQAEINKAIASIVKAQKASTSHSL